VLTKSNASSRVAILKAMTPPIKHALWLVRLYWRERFSKYGTQMLIGWAEERNVVRMWAAVSGERNVAWRH
jgi:hypothetical protein